MADLYGASSSQVTTEPAQYTVSQPVQDQSSVILANAVSGLAQTGLGLFAKAAEADAKRAQDENLNSLIKNYDKTAKAYNAGKISADEFRMRRDTLLQGASQGSGELLVSYEEELSKHDKRLGRKTPQTAGEIKRQQEQEQLTDFYNKAYEGVDPTSPYADQQVQDNIDLMHLEETNKFNQRKLAAEQAKLGVDAKSQEIKKQGRIGIQTEDIVKRSPIMLREAARSIQGLEGKSEKEQWAFVNEMEMQLKQAEAAYPDLSPDEVKAHFAPIQTLIDNTKRRLKGDVSKEWNDNIVSSTVSADAAKLTQTKTGRLILLSGKYSVLQGNPEIVSTIQSKEGVESLSSLLNGEADPQTGRVKFTNEDVDDQTNKPNPFSEKSKVNSKQSYAIAKAGLDTMQNPNAPVDAKEQARNLTDNQYGYMLYSLANYGPDVPEDKQYVFDDAFDFFTDPAVVEDIRQNGVPPQYAPLIEKAKGQFISKYVDTAKNAITNALSEAGLTLGKDVYLENTDMGWRLAPTPALERRMEQSRVAQKERLEAASKAGRYWGRAPQGKIFDPKAAITKIDKINSTIIPPINKVNKMAAAWQGKRYDKQWRNANYDLIYGMGEVSAYVEQSPEAAKEVKAPVMPKDEKPVDIIQASPYTPADYTPKQRMGEGRPSPLMPQEE